MWSNDEIRNSYLNAKSKREQIGILADLCACSKREIEDILVKEGVLDKPKREKPVKPIAEKVQEPRKVPAIVIEMVDSKLDEISEELKTLEDRKAELEKQYSELYEFVFSE